MLLMSTDLMPWLLVSALVPVLILWRGVAESTDTL